VRHLKIDTDAMQRQYVRWQVIFWNQHNIKAWWQMQCKVRSTLYLKSVAHDEQLPCKVEVWMFTLVGAINLDGWCGVADWGSG